MKKEGYIFLGIRSFTTDADNLSNSQKQYSKDSFCIRKENSILVSGMSTSNLCHALLFSHLPLHSQSA